MTKKEMKKKKIIAEVKLNCWHIFHIWNCMWIWSPDLSLVDNCLPFRVGFGGFSSFFILFSINNKKKSHKIPKFHDCAYLYVCMYVCECIFSFIFLLIRAPSHFYYSFDMCYSFRWMFSFHVIIFARSFAPQTNVTMPGLWSIHGE